MNLNFEVKRHRRSVTQGEAAVLVNGKEIVRYGDDIVLEGTSVWIDTKEPRPMYGEIISGYGSTLSDEFLIAAAMRQFSEAIVKEATA